MAKVYFSQMFSAALLWILTTTMCSAGSSRLSIALTIAPTGSDIAIEYKMENRSEGYFCVTAHSFEANFPDGMNAHDWLLYDKNEGAYAINKLALAIPPRSQVTLEVLVKFAPERNIGVSFVGGNEETKKKYFARADDNLESGIYVITPEVVYASCLPKSSEVVEHPAIIPLSKVDFLEGFTRYAGSKIEVHTK